MKDCQAVIFDLDGTLLYTLQGLHECANASLRRFGYPERSMAEIRRFVGNGARRLMERAVPDGTPTDDGRFEALMQDYEEELRLHGEETTVPYPGIPELLDTLLARGVKLGVVSNKPDSAAAPMIRRFFGERFAAVMGKKAGYLPKPDPRAVFDALELLGTDAAHTLYAGDSDVDYYTAKNAGLACVLVSWGYRDREELEKLPALALVDNTEALLKIVGE